MLALPLRERRSHYGMFCTKTYTEMYTLKVNLFLVSACGTGAIDALA